MTITRDWTRALDIGFELFLAFLAYKFLGWVGFALFALLLILRFAHRLAEQLDTVASRLPELCTVCHRAIVDEGGVVRAGGGLYHAVCSDKLDKIVERLKAEDAEKAAKAQG
jgi:membrane protein implicated in regulation of membrane protease activity